MDKEKIRQCLNDQAGKLFDDIVNSRILGASNHIRMIGEIITLTATDMTETAENIINKVNNIARFFIETRGQQSRAIYNSICYYIKGLNELAEKDIAEIRYCIVSRINSFNVEASSHIDLLVTYASNLAENMKSIMLFDYSSTVDLFIKKLSNKRIIYIPESRALDGGRPFVRTAVQAGHEVHFIPDTAMLVALKKCQAAFMGAESIYPDGTVFNTVGSDILAILCRQTDVPLYVLTPMIKIDSRPVYGYIRLSPIPFDYSSRLARHWQDAKIKDQVNFNGIKLLEIRAEFIQALITEKGIFPATAFFHEAMAYASSLVEDKKS